MKILKLFIILTSLLFSWGTSGFAEISSDKALLEFVSAGVAYKDGRYDAAIDGYNTILEGGRVNGSVYYNLGNSYFKKENVGQAVLSYERARKFIPRDSDLNYNDQYVHSKIDRYFADNSQNFIERTFKRHVQFYTNDEMVVILFCIGLLIGAICLISLYFQLPPAVTNGIIALLTISFLVYSAGLVAKVKIEKNLAVVMSATDTFFEPRTDSTAHFKISEGMKVRILKSQGFWVKIERLDGKIGWVDQKVLEEI